MQLRSLKSFRRNEEGSIVVLFAISLLVILMSVSLAWDSALLRSHKAKLQHTVDAALLFASHNHGEDDTKEVFEEILNELWDLNGNTSELEVLSFNENMVGVKSTITAVVTSDYDFVIMDKFVDMHTRLVANSQTEMEYRDVEVALVLDISSSMQGTRITEAKLAARNFTETLFNGAAYNSETRLALVPFGGTVRVPEEMSYMLKTPTEGLEDFSQHWIDGEWNGCLLFTPNQVGNGVNLDSTYNAIEDFYSWNKTNPWCPKAGSELVPLTSDRQVILDKIDSLSLSDGTGTDHGMMWGLESLNSEWANRFPNSETNVPAVPSEKTTKVIILMSDGGITAQHRVQPFRRVGSPPYDTKKKERVSYKSSVTAFETVCERAREEGVIVYTIGYLIRRQDHTDILSSCASSNIHHINAEKGDLNAIFNDIAHDLSPLRLTQ